ncbi:MAG: alpha/beta hydrolase [Steroidobacteraceae bacterium]|jgi:pimeloyl-ACP methyl ester carboxylesterase|nr:alpha/beta hydrolase [Steroidobacteraceae bacterium]
MNARTRTPPAKPVVNLRRLYVDCRFGQLHVRSAFPSSGGFDELTPLVCLHQSPMSSRTFQPFLAPMATDRSVFAPDMPGFGESDAPPSQPAIADYAGAMLDFIDQMRLRQVDLLGYHTGSAIAAEMALARPERIRRIVMVAVPALTAEDRAAFDASPRPAPIREDGAHLAEEWQRSLRWRGPGVTLEQLAAGFAEKLHNGPQAWWGAHAAVQWPAAERLPRLTQPVLVLRPRDDLWEPTLRARGLLRQAQFTDLGEYGFGVFDVAPEVIAREARAFLA